MKHHDVNAPSASAARHASLQAFLVASLSPHLEQFAWDPAPEEPQAIPDAFGSALRARGDARGVAVQPEYFCAQHRFRRSGARQSLP